MRDMHESLGDGSTGAAIVRAAGRRGAVHQLVWGGVHLLERPAAPERMTAILFAHDLHHRDHQGCSRLEMLSDGTYAQV